MSSTASSETSRPGGAWPFITLGVAAICVGIACWAWAQATPALGERPFTGTRIAAARSAAVALWAAGHVLLFGVAVPLIYRRRPAYLGLTGFMGLAATLAGIAALALFAAAANGR